SSSSCRCRRWCWSRRLVLKGRSLDRNHHGRPCLEETDCRIGRKGWLIGIKPEVIQRAEANRVCVLIGRKSFRAPGNEACVLGNIPRNATIASVSLCSVVCKSWMLRRHVKANVTDIDPRSQGDTERLNGPIEVLVIKRVLIVPDSTRRVGDLIAHKPDTVGSGSGLDRVAHRRASPSGNGRLLSVGGADGIKTKRWVDSGHGVLFVRGVVILVALVRMRLAPGAFVRDDVFRFGKICGAH